MESLNDAAPKTDRTDDPHAAPPPLLSVSVKRASPTERISRIQRYLNPPQDGADTLSDWENWGNWGNFGNFFNFTSDS